MKIAVTGCNGNVGKRVVLYALKKGHDVVGIDFVDQPEHDDIYAARANEHFKFVKADLRKYDVVLDVLQGCQGVAAIAAHPNPGDLVWQSHNECV